MFTALAHSGPRSPWKKGAVRSRATFDMVAEPGKMPRRGALLHCRLDLIVSKLTLVRRRPPPIQSAGSEQVLYDNAVEESRTKAPRTSPTGSPTSLYAPHYAGGVQQVESWPVDEFQ